MSASLRHRDDSHAKSHSGRPGLPWMPIERMVSSASSLRVGTFKQVSTESTLSMCYAMTHDEAKVSVKPRIFSAGHRSLASTVTGSKMPISKHQMDSIQSKKEIVLEQWPASNVSRSFDMDGTKTVQFSHRVQEAKLFPRPKSALRPASSARKYPQTTQEPRSIIKATQSKWKSFNLNKSHCNSHLTSSLYESTTAILKCTLPPPSQLIKTSLDPATSSIDNLLQQSGTRLVHHRTEPLESNNKLPLSRLKKSSILETSLTHKLTRALQIPKCQHRLNSSVHPTKSSPTIDPMWTLETMEPSKLTVPDDSTKTRNAQVKWGQPASFVPIHLNERKIVEAKKCRLPLSLQTDFSIIHKYERKATKLLDKSYPFLNPLFGFDKYKNRIRVSTNSTMATLSDPFFARILEIERIEGLTIESELRDKRKSRLVKSSSKKGIFSLENPSTSHEAETVENLSQDTMCVNGKPNQDDASTLHPLQNSDIERISTKCNQRLEHDHLRLHGMRKATLDSKRKQMDSLIEAAISNIQPLAPSAEDTNHPQAMRKELESDISKCSVSSYPIRPPTSKGVLARPPSPIHTDSFETIEILAIQTHPKISPLPKRKTRPKKWIKSSKRYAVSTSHAKTKTKRSSAQRPQTPQLKLIAELLPVVANVQSNDQYAKWKQRSLEMTRIYLNHSSAPEKCIRLAMRRPLKRMMKIMR